MPLTLGHANLIAGAVDSVTLKALATSLITGLGEADPFARKLAKWRAETGDIDSRDRIVRPPQVDFVQDAVKLRMRKEAYAEIFDAWDARDQARKSAAKSAANANRGKQPSGAANRRARELGETGPLAQSIKKMKADDAQAALQSECVPHLVGVRRWFEEKRLLGDGFVVPGQQVSISSSVVRSGRTPVLGVIVERAQLCWEQGAHAAPLQSVVKRDKSGALLFTDPAHCHLVRLHDTGAMVRFSPAHVVPWPRNGARVGNFTGRSASETGVAFRWNVLHDNGAHTPHGNGDTGDTEPGIYHIRRSFYARRSQLLHMMNIHRENVPLRVGDWVWVDVASFGPHVDMGSFTCDYLDEGHSDMQRQMGRCTSASGVIYDRLGYVHQLMPWGIDKYCLRQSTGPFAKRKAVRMLLESSYPEDFDRDTYNAPDIRATAKAEAKAAAAVPIAQAVCEEAAALSAAASAMRTAIDMHYEAAIKEERLKEKVALQEWRRERRGLISRCVTPSMRNCQCESCAPWKAIMRPYDAAIKELDGQRISATGFVSYPRQVGPVKQREFDLKEAHRKAEEALSKALREAQSLAGAAERQRKVSLWHAAVAKKLQSCLPLRSVCIIKAICSTCQDCLEIEETFLANSAQFDVLGDEFVPPSRPTHPFRCSHFASEDS